MHSLIDSSYLEQYGPSIGRLLLVMLRRGDDVEIVDLDNYPWNHGWPEVPK